MKREREGNPSFAFHNGVGSSDILSWTWEIRFTVPTRVSMHTSRKKGVYLETYRLIAAGLSDGEMLMYLSLETVPAEKQANNQTNQTPTKAPKIH